ncbi:MAG TPA: tetratricopeptide repeat protein [Thermoanaerobaculia bacterium]
MRSIRMPRERAVCLGPLVVALAIGSFAGAARRSFAQEAVSPLPPPVTRSLYRSHWFEFLNAHLEDDTKAASAALAEMRKAARTVGVSRLSDFSRTAVHEGRRAEALGRTDRAARAYAAAIQLDDANADAVLSQIAFQIRQRRFRAAAALIPDAFTAMLATQESRLAIFSSLALWMGLGLTAAALAWIIVLLVKNFSRVSHEMQEASEFFLGARGIRALTLVILLLPLVFGFGPVWIVLFWGVLVYGYAEGLERWVLGAGLVLLGLAAPLLSLVARENIIERSPLYVAALDLEERREDASAEDGLRQAAAVFAEDPDVWFLLGMYAERSGDSERAITSYDRAIQANPQEYRSFLNRGNVHFTEGDYSSAIRDYEAAGQRAPAAPEIYYNLSVARAETYDFDGQAAAIAKARELSDARVRGWTERPTLSRVVAVPYTLAQARQKIEQWNAQPKSRRLPGHAPPVRITDLLVSVFTLGPWAALALALLFAAYRTGRPMATECTRCGKPFCRRCKKTAEAPLYCPDCVRLYLHKESAGIEVHVAQTREIQERVRQRDRACHATSFFLPGAHVVFSQKPVAGFLALWLFFFFAAAAAIGLRLFNPRTLPAPDSWHATSWIALSAAVVMWLVSQRAAWRDSHGP